MGLTVPSKKLVNFIVQLERIFRDGFADTIVHSTSDIVKQTLSLFASNLTESIACSSACENAETFLLSLYARVRVHHEMKVQNRLLTSKRNRKYLKISHT